MEKIFLIIIFAFCFVFLFGCTSNKCASNECTSNECASKEQQIEEKVEEIFSSINLSDSKDQMAQLENAMKLHKYIVQNSVYDADLMEEKMEYHDDDYFWEESYNCLIEKRSVCTSDAITLKYLLSKIGINADVVFLESKEGGSHAATLVEIGNEYYYFDPTLERTIFEEQSGDSEFFVFCCAALGSQQYEEFYTPIGLLPGNIEDNILPLPENIANSSVPRLVIEGIESQIPNLTK